MDEETLEKLKVFGFSKPQNRTKYTFREALLCMSDFIKECVTAYDMMCTTKEDMMLQIILNGSIKSFEDFTEAFRDIVTAYYAITDRKVLMSLLECIHHFKKDCNCKEDGIQMLNFLYERNKLVHQYYNREFMIAKYKECMENHSDGLEDICSQLYKKVQENNLLDTEITK